MSHYFRSFKILRKPGSILLSLIIPLLLARQVGSVEPLPHNEIPLLRDLIATSSLALTIPSERVGNYYLEGFNLEPSFISVKSDLDSNWMFLFSSEFKIPLSKAKRILTVFSIPEAEDYQRGGEGIFSTGEENKQA